MKNIQAEIERITQLPDNQIGTAELKTFTEFKKLLNSGQIRAAEKIAEEWHVNAWVKRGILLGFRLGQLSDFSVNEQFRFFDKHTYPCIFIRIFMHARRRKSCACNIFKNSSVECRRYG